MGGPVAFVSMCFMVWLFIYRYLEPNTLLQTIYVFRMEGYKDFLAYKKKKSTQRIPKLHNNNRRKFTLEVEASKTRP